MEEEQRRWRAREREREREEEVWSVGTKKMMMSGVYYRPDLFWDRIFLARLGPAMGRDVVIGLVWMRDRRDEERMVMVEE